MGQKEPPRYGSTNCYGRELGRKSHQDWAIRFVAANRGPERATKTRQYDLLRPNVGQKEPSRLGSTICYGQTWARKSYRDSELGRKSHQDWAIRFVAANRGPERATKTRQYDLLRPNVGQKEPSRLGSTICYGQTWARKSHQDSAVRFIAKRGPERATKIRQYDLLRPRLDQKEPPRPGSTTCYGQALARKSHRDSAVRFVTPKCGPERATETRQYDLLRPNVGQKEPPRLGSTICYGQMWARTSHRDSAVRFFYGQELARKSLRDSAVRFVTAKRGPERATETRQYDLLQPNVGQKELPRLGSSMCFGQTWARNSHQESAVHFVTAKGGPEAGTKTRQYDLLRPRIGQKEPPRLRNTICYGQTWGRKSHQDSAIEPARKSYRFGSTICDGHSWARKSHPNSVVRFVTAKSWPKRATKTRQYHFLPPNVGQNSHQDSAVRFVAAKSWPERATETRQYDLWRPNVGQKEPPRLGSTICYGQMWARKSHRDSAVRFDTVKCGPGRTTKTRQYDLLRPNVGQKELSRFGSTILYFLLFLCFFVTTKSWPQRATKTRQYDLLRPTVAKKEPPGFGSTICYDQTWARKNHRDTAVRIVTAESWAEKATRTGQCDLLRPIVGQKEPPRFGSTICCDQTWARKSLRDLAVRFVTTRRGPERATETRQYDLLRLRVGQKEAPRLGSTIY